LTASSRPTAASACVAATSCPPSWRERDHDDLVLAVAIAAWYAEHTSQRPAGLPLLLGPLPGGRALPPAPFFGRRYDD
jgi:hypothetical protein